jgi:outer membrane biosynthesis protein TonB
VALIILSCARANQPGTTTSASNRVNNTAKAADCRFTMPDSSPLMGESEVDDPPNMTSPGPQRYPPQARMHGIPGRVRVTYVIGRDGLAVQTSLRIVDATNHVFVPSTEEMIYASRFSPGVHLGAPVATCVSQIVYFTIQ